MTERERYSFIAQSLISGSILLFCFFNLSFHEKKRNINEALYAGFISLIIGYWLPSPTAGKQNQVDISSRETNVFPKN